ncbi:protease inhibitor I42 family protein [Mycolicibacterium neworleansense]|nr:protease inhibitor I42 family protein [Mycolicibacterium neworleansense]MCV7365408.1 protease inhibitor I42 family protein [Mycolicibacterium neworleansense]
MSEGMVRPVRWLTSLLLCWPVLMAGGCAPQPDVIATDNDNGGRVQVRSGQLFDIVLADDYDQTGCQWRKDRNSAPSVVEYLGQRYEPARKPPAGTANGTNTMRYRAQQTGTAQIGLVESDNGGRVCRRYAVTVTVGSPTRWWSW